MSETIDYPHDVEAKNSLRTRVATLAKSNGIAVDDLAGLAAKLNAGGVSYYFHSSLDDAVVVAAIHKAMPPRTDDAALSGLGPKNQAFRAWCGAFDFDALPAQKRLELWQRYQRESAPGHDAGKFMASLIARYGNAEAALERMTTQERSQYVACGGVLPVANLSREAKERAVFEQSVNARHIARLASGPQTEATVLQLTTLRERNRVLERTLRGLVK